MTSHTEDHLDMLHISYLKQMQDKFAFNQHIVMATEQLTGRAKRRTALINSQQDNLPSTT